MKIQPLGISLMIMLLAAPFAHADETLAWNEVMLDAIIASTLGNPPTIRMAATVNTAMFDAQNGVGRQRYRPIHVTDRAPPGTDARAAVVQAAYVTLKSFYPEQASRFDEQRAVSLAELDGNHSVEVQRGIEWGEYVANQILAWRATDGFSEPVPQFTGAGAIVGQWESTTGTSMSAGNLAFTAPFVLTGTTQFQAVLPRPWTIQFRLQVGLRSSRRQITRSTRPRIRDHMGRALACCSTSSAIATRSSFTRRSTPSSRRPRRVGSSRGVTHAFRTWRGKVDARTYGGMHFRGSSKTSAKVGAQVADHILQHAAQRIRRGR